MTLSLTRDEIRHYTNYWCKTQGIKSRDLDSHPKIDDVIFLMKFRDRLWTLMSSREQGVWAAYWRQVYHDKMKLHKKAISKFEHIAISTQHREQALKIKIEKIRQLSAKAKQK